MEMPPGLQIYTYAQHLQRLSRKGSLSCNTWCDMGPILMYCHNLVPFYENQGRHRTYSYPDSLRTVDYSLHFFKWICLLHWYTVPLAFCFCAWFANSWSFHLALKKIWPIEQAVYGFTQVEELRPMENPGLRYQRENTASCLYFFSSDKISNGSLRWCTED